MPRISLLFDTADAVLSTCNHYRYQLTRQWEVRLGTVVFVMLNPSTADARMDDPTIRRCISFARTWGYGGINVVNLFAWRATNPAELKTIADPVGPDNDQYLLNAFAQAPMVVVAWGMHAPAARVQEVSRLMQRTAIIPQCLGATQAGHPRHPLYVPRARQLEDYTLPS
ncbi:MAG: DUF1643 domain-containing protein [Hymenobacter sp.]|nr:MAG: DUF1643 domain-containing protein [Hymenobacter sp.]